jgi:predicted deacylase
MTPKMKELDVRPMLRNKQEPFQVIMNVAKELNEKGDTLVLHATFKPEPLLNVMRGKGFANRVEQLEDDHWVVTFTREQ